MTVPSATPNGDLQDALWSQVYPHLDAAIDRLGSLIEDIADRLHNAASNADEARRALGDVRAARAAVTASLAAAEAARDETRRERDEARAELAAVDCAFEGLAETDRARRICRWIGVAADECTARQAAEARADAMAKALESAQADNALLRDVIDDARAEASFAAADEAEGIATLQTRRVRFRAIADALKGVGFPEKRRALGFAVTIDGEASELRDALATNPTSTRGSHAQP